MAVRAPSTPGGLMSSTHASTTFAFADARALLLAARTDYASAHGRFRWPTAAPFNWALDWFDGTLARDPRHRDQAALWILDAATGTESRLSFSELASRSNRVANYLKSRGLMRGDHLLLLLGNVVALWETMLAAMKLGVVIIPATPLLTAGELQDRSERGRVRCVVTSPDQLSKLEAATQGDMIRIVVGAEAGRGWFAFGDAEGCAAEFAPESATSAGDPMLLYFTSGTTAQPKLVRHSHRSYPIGHLSTMYWLGLQPGDIHLNVSSPGWAKHAWSCLFAPWNAGATGFIANQPRFDASTLLGVLERYRVSTFCAPPTVWRFLIQEDL